MFTARISVANYSADTVTSYTELTEFAVTEMVCVKVHLELSRRRLQTVLLSIVILTWLFLTFVYS